MTACQTFILYINKGPKENIVSGSWGCSISGYDVATFQFASEVVRRKSSEIRKVASDWASEFAEGDTEKAQTFWRNLHELGAGLFTTLFGESQNVIRDSLLSASGKCRVVVKHLGCPDLCVPWGFLCDPLVLAEADGGLNNQGEPCFWGVRYNLTINASTWQIHRDTGDWSFISVLHEGRFSPVMESLQDAERTFAEVVQGKREHEQMISPLNYSVIEPCNRCFVYVYAEGDSGNFVFIRNGPPRVKTTLEPIDLLRKLVSRQGTAILILDACNMFEAVPELGSQLQVGLESREVAAVVTEFQINDKFAMRFGLELIDRCLQRGESLNEAMSVMRRQHYPMSIVFALHSKRDLKVTPRLLLLDRVESQTRYRSAIDAVNFSNELGGSHASDIDGAKRLATSAIPGTASI